MKHLSILIAVMAVVLAVPAWAQQPAAGSAAEAKAEATFAALAPLVAAHGAELQRRAGAQKIVARTGKGNRNIQVLTRWGPSYFAWPKGVKPVTFEIYVESANRLDVIAEGFTEANKPLYAAAFDAVLPQAVRSANAARAQATRPKP